MYEILSDRIKNLYQSHQPFFFFDIISQRPKTASPGRRVHLHMHWRLLRLLILGWVISTIHRIIPQRGMTAWVHGFCQGAGGVSTKGAGPYSDSDIMDWRSLGTMAWKRSRFTARHPKFSELGWYKNGRFTMFHLACGPMSTLSKLNLYVINKFNQRSSDALRYPYVSGHLRMWTH